MSRDVYDQLTDSIFQISNTTIFFQFPVPENNTIWKQPQIYDLFRFSPQYLLRNIYKNMWFTNFN